MLLLHRRGRVSNELDGTAMTPAKNLSSGTYESRLFWGAENLSSAGVGVVQELDGESLAQVLIRDAFKKKNRKI